MGKQNLIINLYKRYIDMYELQEDVKRAVRFMKRFIPDDARHCDDNFIYDSDKELTFPAKWVVAIGSDPVCTFGAAWVMTKTQKQWPDENIHFYSISYPQFTGKLGKTWEECLPKMDDGSLLSEVHCYTYLTFNGSDLENAVSQAVNIVKGQLDDAGEPKAKVLFVVTYRDAAYVWLMLRELKKRIGFDFNPLLFISDKHGRLNRDDYHLGFYPYNGMNLADNLPWLTSVAMFAKAFLKYTQKGDILYIKGRGDVEVTQDLIKEAKRLLKKYPLANEKWSIKSFYHSWQIRRNCRRNNENLKEEWSWQHCLWLNDLVVLER